MVIGPPPERPVVLPVRVPDRQVVDAREATAHQPFGRELPVLVAVAAEPLAGVVVPLVGEAHGDALLRERPQLLDQPVIELARPLALQELADLLAADRELRPVAPLRVLRV